MPLTGGIAHRARRLQRTHPALDARRENQPAVEKALVSLRLVSQNQGALSDTSVTRQCVVKGQSLDRLRSSRHEQAVRSRMIHEEATDQIVLVAKRSSVSGR